MSTVAKQLGQTPHLSPLLRRLRKIGLAEPEELRRLAVARGCTHYRRPSDINPLVDPGPALVSNLELAIAMVTAAQFFDPVLVRCAAQLLSGEGIEVETIASLALRERAGPIVRHIAKAGVELDSEGTEKWRRLLLLLPATSEIPEGRLPHRTRFVSQGGVFRSNGRLERTPRSIWLRPTAQAK